MAGLAPSVHRWISSMLPGLPLVHALHHSPLPGVRAPPSMLTWRCSPPPTRPQVWSLAEGRHPWAWSSLPPSPEVVLSDFDAGVWSLAVGAVRARPAHAGACLLLPLAACLKPVCFKLQAMKKLRPA